MKVLVLSNNKLEEKEIDNDLKTLQEIVGGYIEIPFICQEFSDNNILVIMNEDGKSIEGLRPEIALVDKETKQLIDTVYGNCIFVSKDSEGNTIGLTDKQIGILEYNFILNGVLTYENTGEEIDVKFLMI